MICCWPPYANLAINKQTFNCCIKALLWDRETLPLRCEKHVQINLEFPYLLQCKVAIVPHAERITGAHPSCVCYDHQSKPSNLLLLGLNLETAYNMLWFLYSGVSNWFRLSAWWLGQWIQISFVVVRISNEVRGMANAPGYVYSVQFQLLKTQTYWGTGVLEVQYTV